MNNYIYNSNYKKKYTSSQKKIQKSYRSKDS